MEKQGVFRASAFVILLTIFLLPGVAHANNVYVSCPADSLSAAVAALPPDGPNIVTVTGTCLNENVVINDMRSLTIVAGAGGAKIVQAQANDTFDINRSQFIKLVKLEITGVPGSTVSNAGSGVFISQASNVQINECDIHDNEGGGVFVGRGSLLLLNNTNIHNNNPIDGLFVSGSTATVAGTTIQNNGSPGIFNSNPASLTGGVGVFAASNAVVDFRQSNLIQNNADVGIWVAGGSTVVVHLGNGTTVQGHNIDGIVVSRGGHLGVNAPLLVQGNGGACSPETPCAGIFGSGNATVALNTGTVSGNHGAGIFVEQGTNLGLNGATVSNNSGDGVHIRWMSIADFRNFGAGNNAITGNGGASVFCDERSLAIGNLTGFSNVKCGENTQQ